MRFQPTIAALSFTLLVTACSHATAQSRILDVTIHSAGLEHNLLGDPADQPAAIYLPATYNQDAQRRFPVVYFLHGSPIPIRRMGIVS